MGDENTNQELILCPSMVKSWIPERALGCHFFGQSFLSGNGVGRSRTDGFPSLCKGRYEFQQNKFAPAFSAPSTVLGIKLEKKAYVIVFRDLSQCSCLDIVSGNGDANIIHLLFGIFFSNLA